MLTREDAVKTGVPPNFKDRYIIRCIGEGFAPSKKNKPMITLEWELVGFQQPDGTVVDTIKRGDLSYLIAGLQGNTYHVIEPGAALARFFEFQGKLGLNDQDVDDENPTLNYTGITAHAICSSEEFVQRKSPTEEQIAKGELGDEILDPIDNKPIKSYKLRIESILGVANI